MAHSKISLVLVLLLAGCAAAPAPIVSIRALPILKTYDTATNAAMADEWPKVTACCPHIAQLVKDYKTLRAKIRAGQALNGGSNGQAVH